MKLWLSYDIVRFKIEVGVEEKFMCKNVTKQTQHGDRAVAAELLPRSHFCSGTAYNAHTYAEPSRAESFDSARLVLNGDNMLGLCDSSNFLLFEYSFYPPRSDVLFSNYFEDLLSLLSFGLLITALLLNVTITHIHERSHGISETVQFSLCDVVVNKSESK